MLAQLYDLLPRVAAEVAKCPETAQQRALRDAWRVFCRESEAWRTDLAGLQMVSGVYRYAMAIPYDADIERLTGLRWRTDADALNGLPGQPLDAEGYEVEHNGNEWLLRIRDGSPALASGGQLVASVSLVPRMDSIPEVPEAILHQYGDAIASKAIALLKVQAGKPWTDPAGFQVHTGYYNQAKSRIRRAALTHKTGTGNIFG